MIRAIVLILPSTCSPMQVVLPEIRTKPSSNKVVYVYESGGKRPVFPKIWEDVFFVELFQIRDTPDYDMGVIFLGRNDLNKEICDTFVCSKVSKRQCNKIPRKKWRKGTWASKPV
jgi:hypothetical protein